MLSKRVVLTRLEVVILLDDRMLRMIEAKAKGFTITDVAKEAKVSRNTVYKWLDNEEVKAELGRHEQDFISSTKQSVVSYGAKAVRILKDLAENSDNEKVRLDAVSKLLDKVISNAVKIDIENTTDTKDIVTVDVLDKEIEDIDKE